MPQAPILDTHQLAEIAQLVSGIITKHDEFQDGVLVFIGLAFVVNGLFLLLHLRDHHNGRWTENPGWAVRHRQDERNPRA